MSTPRIGSYVRITGFFLGDALYGAEGIYEGMLEDQAQVTLEKPRDLRGRVVHVLPARLQARLRRPSARRRRGLR